MKTEMTIGIVAVVKKPFDFKHVVEVGYFLGA